MNDLELFSNHESRVGAGTMRRPDAADALVAAIRKPLDALEGAAGQAANGMLGGAKLGLLVAVNALVDALNAVDAEFARRYGPSTAGRPRLDREGSDADDSRTLTGDVRLSSGAEPEATRFSYRKQ